jgi:hypothetical protein
VPLLKLHRIFRQLVVDSCRYGERGPRRCRGRDVGDLLADEADYLGELPSIVRWRLLAAWFVRPNRLKDCCCALQLGGNPP